ncbi:MAG: L,D-transpeptidase [Actinomycetota bacterium]
MAVRVGLLRVCSLLVAAGLVWAVAPLPASAAPLIDTAPTIPGIPATTTAIEAKPVPATRTRKARHVPAYPARSREQGKRIVYDKQLMTIWLIDAGERVVARYPVVGRTDRPAAGVYRVYSKSPSSANREQQLTFRNMVRFARGSNTGAAIGFHDIPRTYDGRRIHGEDKLGLPLGQGGSVRTFLGPNLPMGSVN